MNQPELTDFLKRFKFAKGRDGYVGVEREHFLMSQIGEFVPRSAEFLKVIQDRRWTYELSTSQVESRTRPRKDLSAIQLDLLENALNGEKAAEKLGLRLVNREVGNENMPLDVYPDPRYFQIARAIPRERLAAACRAAGTHLHLGVRNIACALRTHNLLVPHLDELCRIGDHSRGERLGLYKTMAINWQPIVYESVEHFFAVALADGFAANPRNCWRLMRISVHGTVELRMFGVTDYVDEILWWISKVKYLTRGVL